ncbi:GNAT family N-acetyltransferase [Ferrigenium kumadai]|uniref:GNAT family N-acetyltransferase n=1 Tax=Ferrigenium kumadai TaxID=1682490 RepID=A0AAN1VZW7_9PROT|nr:GNAT family N-acetyltransferase [Ferrigenium kumadai]BBI99873.1 GNAT family N-acetyltransferase [Ferrigenium kumadai]
MSNPFTVSLISWHDGEPLLCAVREAVFMREQGVPEELEWDGQDEGCRHALALSLQGEAVGCGRLLPDGHIGRIAVLPEWRNRKVGTAIMEILLAEARARGLPQVAVDAQTQAVPFYHGFGFVERGDVFMDAGLPHIKMGLKL